MRTFVPARSSRVWPGACFAPASRHGRRSGGELGAVREVQNLRLRLKGVDVIERDVAGGAPDQGRVSQ